MTTLRDDVPLLFPTAHELACAALGASPEAASEVRGPAGTLHIAVTHGDLREAKFPVIVGHYAGDSIVSAEGALDRQLGGRLQRRLDVGLYAGEENTAEVFLDPQAKPPGAIVVGFGEIGSMSAESVRRAVCRGTLSYAVKLLEPHRDGDGQPKRCEGVSAVLLGTNGGRALAPIEAVSAIVNGVVDANAQLVARGLHTRVFIDRLEIIELYEDAALEAQRSLIWFVNSAPAALRRTIALCAEPRLRTGSAGSSHRPYNHYHTGWWRRMLISDTSAGDADIVSLKFEILTDRARVEEKMKIGQRALIDDFLAAARRSSAYAPETAATLFELLIPRELKPRMQLDASLLLVLDDESARYPWEMLAQRVSSGIEPLAERLGILRQFKVAKTRPSERGPRGFSALVIGNPTTHLPPLPGAHAEAVEVAKLLNAGRLDLGDGPLLEASATEIITRFFARDYRVVHIAAHGEVRAASRPADSAETSGARNGVVIGDHRWLTAAEVEALPVTPDLVFLNCCHLGKMSADPQAPAPELNLPKPGLFAASIAKELIAAGVRVVVVAAWAVDDLAAREFAKCFYEHLLAHEPLGRAVLAARKKVRQLYPQTNTWAAYQVYGDPEFRLETPNESAQQAGGSYRSPYEEYYGRSEVLAELRALAAQARWNGSAADSTGIEKTLAKIATKLPEDWRDGEVLEALGDAWGAYNFLPKAIHAYREALRHVKGEAALRTLPAIIDAEIRLLEQLAAGAAPREIKQLQHDIKTDVDLLAQFGETAERLSAVGALWKRMALLAKTPEDRKRALLAASKHYGDAHQLARQQQRVDPYPGLNWFLYRWLLGEKHLAKTDPDFAVIKAEVADRLRRSTDFWDIVSGADLLIITHLYAGDLPACEKKIREAFRRALLFGASPKDRAILASHLEFIAKMLPKELAALAATLRILAEFIRSADVQ